MSVAPRGAVEIVYYVAASLDGRIATADGGVAWLDPYQSAGEDYGYSKFLASAGALLIGRRTYEQVLTFGPWPYADKACWVFTRRAHPSSAPANVTFTKASPRAVVTRMRAQGLRRAWLVGGGKLAGAFHKAGLITEYQITYVPVVLGSGVELLGGSGPERALRFVSQRAYPNGLVQVRCVPERARKAGR